MLTMSEGIPVRRSTSKPNAPCFVLASEGNHVSQAKADTMKDLIARTDGVYETAKQIKHFITKTFLVSVSPTGNFLSKEEFTVTEEKKTFSSKNFVSALKDHYILLSKLVKYTEYARTNNIIGIGKKPGSSKLKRKLLDVENQLFQVMCDIKIALLGQKVDAQIASASEHVSSAFKSSAESYDHETKRAYILMNDYQDIMKFLKQMYTVM